MFLYCFVSNWHHTSIVRPLFLTPLRTFSILDQKWGHFEVFRQKIIQNQRHFRRYSTKFTRTFWNFYRKLTLWGGHFGNLPNYRSMIDTKSRVFLCVCQWVFKLTQQPCQNTWSWPLFRQILVKSFLMKQLTYHCVEIFKMLQIRTIRKKNRASWPPIK